MHNKIYKGGRFDRSALSNTFWVNPVKNGHLATTIPSKGNYICALCPKMKCTLRPSSENAKTSSNKPINLRDIHQANLRDLPVPYRAEAWQEWFRRGNYPQLTLKDKEALERLTPLEQQFIQFDQRN